MQPSSERLRLLRGQATLLRDLARHAPVDLPLTAEAAISFADMLEHGADWGCELTAAQQRIAELEIALRDVLGFLRTACEDPEWVSSAHREARDWEEILRAGQGGGE